MLVKLILDFMTGTDGMLVSCLIPSREVHKGSAFYVSSSAFGLVATSFLKVIFTKKKKKPDERLNGWECPYV